MKKITITLITIFCISLFLITLNPISNVKAVSYYNWIRNHSFEGDINLIEDYSFESGVINNTGVQYGNWSITNSAQVETLYYKEGFYSLECLYSGAVISATYDIISSYEQLGANIEEFTFYFRQSAGYGYEVRIYYTDDSYTSVSDTGTNDVWVQEDLTSNINDGKIVDYLYFRIQNVGSGHFDNIVLSIGNPEGQTHVSLTSSPWGIIDIGETLGYFFPLGDLFDLDSDITNEQSYSGEYSFEFIEGESAPIFQSIALLDSDLIHYPTCYVKTNNTNGVEIAFGVNYASGRGLGGNETVPYNSGNWQKIVFSIPFYSDDYVTGILIFVFDDDGNGDSTYIDDVELLASVKTSWKRLDWSVSPTPISKGQKTFTAYQRQTYTLTMNLYDENIEQTESGTYQFIDGEYSISQGSFSNGGFTVTLNKRTSNTVDSISDEIIFIIDVGTETIQMEISALWRYVAIPDIPDESERSDNLINWLTMFMVIFLPALLFAGGIYENNQQPDSMHISPIFGIIAGLCLSIGIGVYTSLVPLWILILMIVAIVILIVGLIKN